MKFCSKRITGIAVAVASLGTATAPAQAGPEWEFRGTRTVNAGVTDVLSAIGNLLSNGAAPCVPTTRRVQVEGALSVSTWWSPQTLQVRYDESGAGSSTISTDCPGTSVTVETEVVDYAPGGSPTVVQDGSQRTTTPDPRNGTKSVTAFARDTTVTVYYDPPAGYDRGNSAISIRVTGYYTSPKSKSAPVRFACVQATWVVTPTPYGPIFMNSEPYMSGC
jgi:hypothetical protein